MSAAIFNDGKFQGIGNDGVVVPYGMLYVTDSCSGAAVNTYTDAGMGTANTYPIVLSASGKADVFLTDGEFDITLKDKNGTTVWTINNFTPATGNGCLSPTTLLYQKEEITGVTGVTATLSYVPVTEIMVHKNGLLLYSDEYSLLEDVLTFTVALISTDEVVVEYSIFANAGLASGIVYTVDTVADLLTLDVTVETVRVLGYTADSDGGEGVFVYDASRSGENDSGTVFDGWVRQYSGAVNVRWFGVSGTDITSTALKIQNIVDDFKKVYLPEGTYFVNTAIVLASNREFYGDDENTIIKIIDSADAQCSGVVVKDASYTTVRNIKVDGNGSRTTNPQSFPNTIDGSCVVVNDSDNILIRDVTAIDAMKHCFDITADAYDTGDPETYVTAGRCEYVNIESCYASGGGDDNFTTHQSDYLLITGCVSENPSGDAVPANSNCYEIDDGSRYVTLENSRAYGGVCGVQVKGHDIAAAPKHIVVQNMHIEYCNYSIDCYNTSFYGVASGGYSTTAYGLIIKNIFIHNIDTDNRDVEESFAVRIRSYTNVVVDGIVITDSSSTYDYGLVAITSGARNVAVSNIDFKNVTGDYGIRMTDTTNNVVIQKVKAADCTFTSVVYLSDVDDDNTFDVFDVYSIDTNCPLIKNNTADLTAGSSFSRAVQWRARAFAGVAVDPRPLIAYGWVEGNQDLAEGEGNCVQFTAQLTSDTEAKPIVEFGSYKVDAIDSDRSSYAYIATSDNGSDYPTPKLRIGTDGTITPWVDDSYDVGSASFRWDNIYATNGTIQTSDEREKTALTDLTDIEKAVAADLKAAIKTFRFISAVEEKGNNARIHTGVGAQTVRDIFKSHGLVPEDYALFCYDEWKDGNRYGIRYEELLAFIISAM